MSQYDNTNRGVLFKNEDKYEETHADYRGNINIDGKEFWLDAWIRTSKAGKKFMSLSVKPKKQAQSTQPRREQVPGEKRHPPIEDSELSDDITFAWAIAFPAAALLASILFGASSYVA